MSGRCWRGPTWSLPTNTWKTLAKPLGITGYKFNGCPVVRNDHNLTLTTKLQKMVAHWMMDFKLPTSWRTNIKTQKMIMISVQDICKRSKGSMIQPVHLLLSYLKTLLQMFVFSIILFYVLALHNNTQAWLLYFMLTRPERMVAQWTT